MALLAHLEKSVGTRMVMIAEMVEMVEIVEIVECLGV